MRKERGDINRRKSLTGNSVRAVIYLVAMTGTLHSHSKRRNDSNYGGRRAYMAMCLLFHNASTFPSLYRCLHTSVHHFLSFKIQISSVDLRSLCYLSTDLVIASQFLDPSILFMKVAYVHYICSINLALSAADTFLWYASTYHLESSLSFLSS